MTVPGNDVVGGISNRTRHDPGNSQPLPPPSQVGAQTQRGGGLCQDPSWSSGINKVDPEYGVDLVELSVMAQKMPRIGTSQTRKQQRVVFFVPQDELNLSTAETAVVVIQQDVQRGPASASPPWKLM